MKRLRINPVYKKELKTSVRSARIALTLLAYNGLLALIGLIAFYTVYQNAQYSGMNYQDILVAYTVLIVMEFGLILFVIPAYTASAISGERERQTLEILLTTSMKPIQIIWGKLLSSISTVLLLVISSVPVLSLVFSIGGVSVGDLMKYVLLVVVTAVYAGSFGLLFSVIFKKTTISTVCTYGMLLMLGAGTVVILLVIYLLLQQYYDTQYYAGLIQQYYRPDLGYGLCLLLVNPAITIAAMLFGQFGSIGEFYNIMEEFGTVSHVLTDHWFGISLVVQVIVSILVLHLAARMLDPLTRGGRGDARRERRKRRKEQRGHAGA